MLKIKTRYTNKQVFNKLYDTCKFVIESNDAEKGKGVIFAPFLLQDCDKKINGCLVMEIKEAYVSYDVAKLLYERGFNEPCDMYYKMSCKSDEPEEVMWEELNYGQERYIKAPTHQMATDWLRVRHGMFVHIVYEPEHNDKFEWHVLIRKDGTILKCTDGIRDSDYHKLLDHAIRCVVKGYITANIE